MKIERIRTYHLRTELTPAEAFAYSQARISARTAMLVEIVADDGRSGWGEAYGPPAPSKTIIDELYAPRLIGRDPMDTTVIWEELYAAMRDYGRTGFPVAALSAVDIALWDLKGKTLAQPVAKLLGGAFRAKLTAYATGLYRHDVSDHAAALAAEARGYINDGFRSMKLKVGFGVEEDARSARAVREAIGRECRLAVDANHAYDAMTAIRLGRLIEPLDIAWFEEPVVPEDLDGYLQVKQALDDAHLGRRGRVRALRLPRACRAPLRGHPPAGRLRLRRLHRGRSHRRAGQHVGHHGLSARLGQRGGAPREHAMGGLAAAESRGALPGRALVRAGQDGQSFPRTSRGRAARARRCYHRGPRAARARPRGGSRRAGALRSHDRRDEAMRLQGKVAVVTGGGAGIGRGIVLCMAKEGADVAIPDIQDANAQSVVKEVQALGRKAVSMRCDVTKAADVKASLDRIKKDLGRIDILVNNAGMASAPGMPFTNNTEEDWDKTYAVNLKSVFLTCKEIAPYFIERKAGRIINIASIAGPLAAQTMPPYSVAKGGVITFTRVLAKELAAHGITVNAICPGVLWTAFWEKLAQYIADTNPAFKGMTARQVFDKRVGDIIPMKREQTPEDIGWAATFLASEEARNITGQALNVDGGSVMH